jgi:hypothetical protein
MRNLIAAVVGSVFLAAAGFAAASIAKGPPGGVGAQTVTGATTGPILTGTTPTRKQTICHKTHSKKNPSVTITVSQNAVPAHLAHGDHLGPCTAAELKAGKQTSTTGHQTKPKTKAKTKSKTKSKATSKATSKTKATTKHKPKKTSSKSKEHGKPATTGKPANPGKPSNPGNGHHP